LWITCGDALHVGCYSDDKPHKVTIAMLTLPALFRHYCVPKAAALAYVQALCVNSSAVTLLASGQVNVFFGTSRG
jgi:hypothetical protein